MEGNVGVEHAKQGDDHAHEADGADAVAWSAFFEPCVWCAGQRGGEGGVYKPPAMRMRATPIFWKNGTFMGRSIQMGSNKIAKSVSMLSVLAV